jgi:branched-chain amino acid transport system substrate-binding protein
MTQFQEAPSNSIVFIQYGPINAEYCDLAGDKAAGVVYQSLGGAIMGGTSKAAEMAAEIREKYEATHGPSGYFYNTGYWMPQLYAQAIQATGGVEHREIGDWFSELDVITGSGRLKFDPNTHLGTYGDDYLPLQVWQIMPPLEGASAAECERPLVYPPTLTDDEFVLPPWAENPLGT